MYPAGSLKNAELCCILMKAKQRLTPDEYEKFKQGAIDCVKGFGKILTDPIIFR
jgi:hypothetical protein